MAALTHLAIRTLHVVGMGLLLGGAAATWLLLRQGVADPLGVALRFEWASWVILGVLVVTGVGNLGAVGAPGPATVWGRTLLVKLLVVFAFVVGSLVRTLAVVRMEGNEHADVTLRRWTGRAYGVTTGTLLLLAVLGEVLAHG